MVLFLLEEKNMLQLVVLMVEMGIDLGDIHDELASRHVIDHKVKQEKMTK